MNQLAFIIPVFNKSNITIACLSHLLSVIDRARETMIFVVDNGSTDDTRDVVGSRFRGINLICMDENKGFAAAVNAGMRAAPLGYDFVVMNNDVFPDPGIETGIERSAADLADKNPGVIGAKLRFANGLIQHAGAELSHSGRGIHYGGEFDHGQYDRYLEVEYNAFALVYIPERVLQAVGFMDEGYFLYYEDVDYCRMVRAGGFRVFYSPHISGIHLHNQSGKQLGATQNARYEAQSKKRFLEKWDAKQ